MNVRVRDLDIPTMETIDGLNNKRIELSKNPVATCGMDLHVGNCLSSQSNNVIYTNFIRVMKVVFDIGMSG